MAGKTTDGEVRRQHAAGAPEIAAAHEERDARASFLATGHPYAEEEVPVRAALRLLAARLRAISDEWAGELGAEARLAWLDSLLPLHRAEDLVRVLSHVDAVVQQVGNWSDCVRLQTPTRIRKTKDEAECHWTAARTLEEFIRGRGMTLIEGNAAVRPSVDLLVPALDARAKELHAIVDSAEEDAFDKFVAPAQDAANNAIQALCALVDAVRQRAPEQLQ